MNEKKIFKRFMLRYLMAGFLVLAGSIPFILMAYKHIRDYTISDNIANLKSGITEIENNIQKMNMISLMISEEPNLRSLKQIAGDITTDKVLNMKYLADQMFDLKCIYDFSLMFFVMFYNNDAFVSTDQVSDSFSKYYGRFFEADKMTGDEFKKVIFDKQRKTPFIYVEQLKYYITNREMITKNAVLYVEPIELDITVSTNKAVMVFILDEKKLVETLLSTESIKNGLTRITDGSGNVIVNYGNSADTPDDIKNKAYIKNGNETLKLLTYDNIKKDLTITVGFPMSLINQQMKDIIRLLFIYLSIGIIFALVLTVVFSVHWYAPYGTMLKEVARFGTGNTKRKNEFDFIRESILNLVSAKDELETKILLANTQKQAIMLENIFIKGFYKKEEEAVFLHNFPQVKNGYYVAYLQIQSEEDTDKNQSALVTAIGLLEEEFDEGLIHVHTMLDTEILLLPAKEELSKEALLNILKVMKDTIIQQFPVICRVGLSQRENEISNINVAYAHARQTVHAYKNTKDSFAEYYQYINDREIGCFDMSFLNKLYELILCSGKKEICHMFEEVRQECMRHKERYEFHKAEVYHAISFIIYTAYQQLSFIPKEDVKLKEFQQNHSLVQCLNILEQAALELCGRIDENKRSRNVELKNKIIKYLENNYRRVELTADIVSREVGISEKYLSTFVKESTGKTFSLYLDELRIGYSKDCLENTNWSNDRIAEEAGFGAVNSFYRVFKKYVGISPNVYKKSRQGIHI